MRARKELMVVLYHIFISPFGTVRFKHFFLADVITSFVNPLKDIGFICAFFFSGKWLNSELPSTKDNEALLDYTLIVVFLPYWFRFAQCLRRFQETKLKAHLVNAGKYFSCMLI
jgi:predicted permease